MFKVQLGQPDQVLHGDQLASQQVPRPLRRDQSRAEILMGEVLTSYPTRTAEDAAARAVGCQVGQIVKSLVVLADETAVLASSYSMLRCA